MGIIHQKVTLVGSKSIKKDIDAIVDTGSSKTVIPKLLADELGFFDLRKELQPIADYLKLKIPPARSKAIDHFVETTASSMGVLIGTCGDVVPISIVENADDILIGADTLQRFSAKIKMNKEGKDELVLDCRI